MISERMVSVCTLSLACLVGFAGTTFATTYEGSMSYSDNGLYAAGAWADTVTTLSWRITNEQRDPSLPANFVWKYVYTFLVPAHSPSHLILEASSTFTNSDIAKVNGAPNIEINTFNPTNAKGSNPNMPESIYGIKFDNLAGESNTLQLSFYSDRLPVWGDFYCKDGKGVLAYNAGFADVDPTAAPCNGSVNNHLLVPDTQSEIPEPSLLTLLSIGSLTLLRKRRG